MELPEEIKSAMSEIEVADNLLANGNRLMDLESTGQYTGSYG